MTTYTIGQIERAINIWRARSATGEDGALCSEARVLAKPYTLMFLARQESIEATALSVTEHDALRSALGQDALPL
jgi:hypothetical protein